MNFPPGAYSIRTQFGVITVKRALPSMTEVGEGGAARAKLGRSAKRMVNDRSRERFCTVDGPLWEYFC